MSEELETVMVNCRAPRGYGQHSDRSAGSKGCGGRHAKVVFKTNLPKGGLNIRYQCVDCNRYFSISL